MQGPPVTSKEESSKMHKREVSIIYNNISLSLRVTISLIIYHL